MKLSTEDRVKRQEVSRRKENYLVDAEENEDNYERVPYDSRINEHPTGVTDTATFNSKHLELENLFNVENSDNHGSSVFLKNAVPNGVINQNNAKRITKEHKGRKTLSEGNNDDKGKADQDKADQEKAEKEKADKAKADQEKAEKEKADKAKADQEKADQEKAEKEKADKAKADQEKAEKEKADKAKADQEKADQEKAEKEKADKAKADQEKADQEKAEKEKADEAKADQDKVDQVKAEKEKADKAKADQEKADQEKAEKEKADKAKADQAKADQEKAEKEKAEKTKADQEKADQEKADKEKADEEKIAVKNKADKAKSDQEKADQEKAEKEKADKEKADQEKADNDKADTKIDDNDKAEKDKAGEKSDKEKDDKEKDDQGNPDTEKTADNDKAEKDKAREKSDKEKDDKEKDDQGNPDTEKTADNDKAEKDKAGEKSDKEKDDKEKNDSDKEKDDKEKDDQEKAMKVKANKVKIVKVDADGEGEGNSLNEGNRQGNRPDNGNGPSYNNDSGSHSGNGVKYGIGSRPRYGNVPNHWNGYSQRNGLHYNVEPSHGNQPTGGIRFDGGNDYKGGRGYRDARYPIHHGGASYNSHRPLKFGRSDYRRTSSGRDIYGAKSDLGGHINHRLSHENDGNVPSHGKSSQYVKIDDTLGNPSSDRTYDNYGSKSNSGYDKYGRPSYGNPTQAPPVYEAYTSHYKADVSVPFPYTAFADPKDTTLKIPKLGDYHCFLTGAPWTTCGRKSLTTYFLDQCLVLYFTLSANVDGICGGEPPKPTPKPDVYNDYYYSSDYNRRETYAPSTKKPTPAPEAGYGATTAAPSPTPSSYEITPDYLKEKCLQSSYVSITTATVMCLTENYIRINFIEHYAASACNNPVEGPILYLKKLHAFIHSVKECTGDAASNNYPNLYRTFEVEDKVAYNPNAPYYLDSDKKVTTQQYTSGEASGLAAFTLGDSFMCANTEQLDQYGVYGSTPGSPHYKPQFYDELQFCPDASSAAKAALAAAGEPSDPSKLIRYCKTSQYTTDRTYRGLYDAVHFIDRKSSALHRPQSIAEIAVRSAGILEQPILEGFGIVYYCAFHACRANNDGDLSKCYPEFKAEDDWNSSISQSALKKLSDDVNDCITDGYLDSDDIILEESVESFNNLLSQRTYLCLAEGEIVDFLGEIYAGWAEEEDAISLVYGRHLADEKCFAHEKCQPNKVVYDALNFALDVLLNKCGDAKKSNTQHSPYGGYGRPQYGDPQYGTEAKYGRQPTKNNYYRNENYRFYGNDNDYDDASYVGYDNSYEDGEDADYGYGSYDKDNEPSSHQQYSASRV
ncbi:unnamed protein product [Aphanomyces euteiches]